MCENDDEACSRSCRIRSLASLSSFRFSAALWLSVSLIMFLKNRVFGLGAPLVGLLGIYASNPWEEYFKELSRASRASSLAT